jgi:hypothetical protein
MHLVGQAPSKTRMSLPLSKRYRPMDALPATELPPGTLIEKHEKEKKEHERLEGAELGRKAAGVDAADSAMGSLGLFVFVLLVWQFMPGRNAWPLLVAATSVWLMVFRSGLADPKNERSQQRRCAPSSSRKRRSMPPDDPRRSYGTFRRRSRRRIGRAMRSLTSVL